MRNEEEGPPEVHPGETQRLSDAQTTLSCAGAQQYFSQFSSALCQKHVHAGGKPSKNVCFVTLSHHLGDKNNPECQIRFLPEKLHARLHTFKTSEVWTYSCSVDVQAGHLCI